VTAHELARKLLAGPDVEVRIELYCHGCEGPYNGMELKVEANQEGTEVWIFDDEPVAIGPAEGPEDES
jgi:hypothetical protein